MEKINTEVYSSDRRAPLFSIENNSYIYKTSEDTGTGRAYSSLIIFDLAIFNLTQIPILIHDSFLFKNIENEAIKKIMPMYDVASKQVFIAIDEIAKYGEETANFLISKKVIQLNANKQLYIKDWKSRKNP